MVTVVVDSREPVVIRELLEERGAHVHVEALAAGDYLLGERCVVERKYVVDLHRSLLRGRLWAQIGLIRAFDDACLLIEGRDLAGPVPEDALRGALLAIGDLGVTVMRSRDRADSAAWLYRLAHRRQTERAGRSRPRYAQRPRSPTESVPEAMLAAIPGISRVTAVALLERFGDIATLAAQTPREWQRVPGVGPERARALARALGIGPATSRSGLGRNGPST
jgi:ERCC4-type nuclease